MLLLSIRLVAEEAWEGVRVSKWCPAFLLNKLKVSVPVGVAAVEFIVIKELREQLWAGLFAVERVRRNFG